MKELISTHVLVVVALDVGERRTGFCYSTSHTVAPKAGRILTQPREFRDGFPYPEFCKQVRENQTFQDLVFDLKNLHIEFEEELAVMLVMELPDMRRHFSKKKQKRKAQQKGNIHLRWPRNHWPKIFQELLEEHGIPLIVTNIEANHWRKELDIRPLEGSSNYKRSAKDYALEHHGLANLNDDACDAIGIHDAVVRMQTRCGAICIASKLGP